MRGVDAHCRYQLIIIHTAILEIHLIYLNLLYQCNAGISVKTFSSISSDDLTQKSCKQENCFIFMNYFATFMSRYGWRGKKNNAEEGDSQAELKPTPHTVLRMITYHVPALLNVYSLNILGNVLVKTQEKSKLFHRQVRPEHLTNNCPVKYSISTTFSSVLWLPQLSGCLSEDSNTEGSSLPTNSQSCVSSASKSLFMGK